MRRWLSIVSAVAVGGYVALRASALSDTMAALRAFRRFPLVR